MMEQKEDFWKAVGTDAVDAAIELLNSTVFPTKHLGLVLLAVEALKEKREQINEGRETQ